jgi:glutathione peroxidase
MRLSTLAVAATLIGGLAPAAMAADAGAAPAGDAYQFSFTSIDGKPMSMADFKGKTVLVVNTASQCGFTPQYTALEAVYKKYKDKGLVVLGVPSNDFGGQEPGSNSEIKKFCEGNYDVDFPMTAKYDVKGDSAHPFFKWAAAVGGTPAVPAWNFHKLLIGPNGQLLNEFPSKVTPDSQPVETAIETAMAYKG